MMHLGNEVESLKMNSEPIVQISSTCNSPLEEAQAEEDAQSASICLVLQVPMAHDKPFLQSYSSPTSFIDSTWNLLLDTSVGISNTYSLVKAA